MDTSAGDVRTNQETVEFVDTSSSYSYAIPSTVERLAESEAQDTVSLEKFLQRPAKIFSYLWTENDAVGTAFTINPWRLYFSDTYIKYKLNNWAFIRCDLKIKVLINASPFYYGAAMLSYQPLQNFTASTIIDDGTQRNLIPLSQRPKIMIYPQLNEGMEMSLPFFWPYQYLRCCLAQDFTDMGSMTLSLITQLQSATAATGAGITISLYAWAENVTLCGPTLGLALQVKDEYMPDGIISAPASAVAAFAGRMTEFPVVGKFAKATEIGASAVSGIAKLFGFTDVPQIGDIPGYDPKPLPPLASTEIGFPTEKLTIDSKNELTIDPSAVGLSNLDELAVSSLVQRESFLTQFNWTSAMTNGTLMFTSAITPSTMYDAGTGTGTPIYMTPIAWISTMHKYWRGDVILRFRFVASQYHKGRVRISYDPDGYSGGNIVNSASNETAVLNKIVDLDKETDVEFRIPFSQYVAWCTTRNASAMTNANIWWTTGTSFNHIRGATNGTITLRVATVLSGPLASASIQCLVFVRGADNLEFASPSLDGTDRLSVFSLQAGEGVIDTGEKPAQEYVPGKLVSPVDHLYLTYMGEAIRSLRTLMRRKCAMWIWSPRTTGDYGIAWLFFYRMPPLFGYDPNGFGTAKGLVVPASSFSFNWTQNNFISYVSQAFVANRGAVNYCFTPIAGSNGNVLQWLRVYRKPNIVSMGPTSLSSAPTNYDNFYWTNTDNGGAGQAVGTRFNNNVVVSVPYYSAQKFSSNTPNSFTNSSHAQHELNSNMAAEIYFSATNGVSSDASRVPIQVSAGADFTCLFFLNVPTYNLLSSVPNP